MRTYDGEAKSPRWSCAPTQVIDSRLTYVAVKQARYFYAILEA